MPEEDEASEQLIFEEGASRRETLVDPKVLNSIFYSSQRCLQRLQDEVKKLLPPDGSEYNKASRLTYDILMGTATGPGPTRCAFREELATYLHGRKLQAALGIVSFWESITGPGRLTGINQVLSFGQRSLSQLIDETEPLESTTEEVEESAQQGAVDVSASDNTAFLTERTQETSEHQLKYLRELVAYEKLRFDSQSAALHSEELNKSYRALLTQVEAMKKSERTDRKERRKGTGNTDSSTSIFRGVKTTALTSVLAVMAVISLSELLMGFPEDVPMQGHTQKPPETATTTVTVTQYIPSATGQAWATET